METRKRNIIVGSVVFLALTIIFVPMLFDKPIELRTVEPIENLPSSREPIDPPVVEPPPTEALESVKEEINSLVDEDGFVTEKGVEIGEPKLTPETEDTARWAVQLASFSEETKAQSFLAQVEADGFHSWVYAAKVNDATVHRVVAGPYVKRDDAVADVETFKDKYKVQPIIVDFDY